MLQEWARILTSGELTGLSAYVRFATLCPQGGCATRTNKHMPHSREGAPMKTRRWLAVPVLIVAMLMTMSSAASAQVLQNVPNDAVLVIKIKNLKDVSTKVAALAQQLGVAGLNPAMADPLAAVQQKSGITNGLDQNGDIAIYVPSSALDHPDAAE